MGAPADAGDASIWRLRASFFLFGTINNVLYVIILSAALDLVPQGTPKGIIAFCNIAPALLAKFGWPYLLKGRVRYTRRIIACTAISVLGMAVVAIYESLNMRLMGIALASLSSGLGELTFLQLSTTYREVAAREAIGYFSSGTGGAGLLGAALWWVLRSLGVREGVGISAVLPFALPASYFLLLPSPAAYQYLEDDAPEAAAYAPIPSGPGLDSSVTFSGSLRQRTTALSAADKWQLVKPLIGRFMVPLFAVYTFEYTINQGISPTLLFPVPDAQEHRILHLIIKSLRDYYPFWQLVYQSFVFLSRSSISLGVPPLARRLLPVPAMLQGCILTFLALESAYGILPEAPNVAIPAVAFFIAVEGLCGGLAYVTAFYRVGQEAREASESNTTKTPERLAQEREFQMGSIGLADSFGILLASLLAVPTEVSLCKAQVARGRELCRAV
ncbi:batten's disease protein Cln3 [Clavulina sp. PMI_390]|nr:batten's disease protein Cln3 [Clavulina sp. PMI_390]